MKIASHILGLAIACVAVPAMAKPAYIASTVNLRAAPGTGSEIVAKIPGGSLVDTGGCDEGWCEITWQDKKGFAIQTALDMSGRVPRNSVPPQTVRPIGKHRAASRWLKVLRLLMARSITIRRRSFTTVGLTTGLTGAGTDAIGGDGYFACLLPPNIRPSATSVIT